MSKERESAQDCKATYKSLQKSLNGFQGFRWGVQYIRSLEDTVNCDHIYDLTPLRERLRDRADNIDPTAYLKIQKHQESTVETSMAEEIVNNAKVNHNSHLSRAVWRARRVQCVELYDEGEKFVKWFSEKWKNGKDA